MYFSLSFAVIEAIGLLNVIIFVVIGIGVDDVFVFVNTFKHSAKLPGLHDRYDRITHTILDATKATFFTSLTTSVAFLANVVSSVSSCREGRGGEGRGGRGGEGRGGEGRGGEGRGGREGGMERWWVECGWRWKLGGPYTKYEIRLPWAFSYLPPPHEPAKENPLILTPSPPPQIPATTV